MTTRRVRAEDRVMFEIYREGSYNRAYRVVYYSELGDANRDKEIARAMAGDHVFDGFLAAPDAREAKAKIKRVLVALNDGADPADLDLQRELAAFLT